MRAGQGLQLSPATHPRTPDSPASIFPELGLHVCVTMLALRGTSAGDSA